LPPELFSFSFNSHIEPICRSLRIFLRREDSAPGRTLFQLMPRADTRYFGPTEYSADAVIRLPRGLHGYEIESEFLIIQLPDQYPLVYLQSIRNPGLCFVALPVFSVDAGYDLQLAAEDSRLLGTQTQPRIGEEVLCLALVAVTETGASANLLAPVVVNLRSRIAAQCINAGAEYSHQQSLIPAQEVMSA